MTFQFYWSKFNWSNLQISMILFFLFLFSPNAKSEDAEPALIAPLTKLDPKDYELHDHLEIVKFGLKDLKEIKVVTFGNTNLITGFVNDLSEYETVNHFGRTFPEFIVDIHFSPNYFRQRTERMNCEIEKRLGSGRVLVTRLETTYLLEGRLRNSRERKMVTAIVETLLPLIESSNAIKEGYIIPGARQYAIRDLTFISQDALPALRHPAVACTN